MSDQRFLLIKGLNTNFWINAHQTLEMLLAAESCYKSAFDMYFEPVSPYPIEDVPRQDFTYDPPDWRYDNLTADDLGRLTRMYRNAGQIMDSHSNVVVNDISLPV
jgi:hypothetical protein